MRNLKRALSLALASVMMFGMMVVGTSAASYKDVKATDNVEAIEVLKAVGVMVGDEAGNFNPDKNVTRNEMAVVMCNLLNLKAGGNHPFTDVPAWAAPYVAACYNNGIIAGYSATVFGGNDTVTAAQAALMVMKTLGYFGYQGEFGDDWKTATIKQATKIDLFDGVNVYADEAMIRNNIAKLVLNALESDVVVITEEGGVSVEGNGLAVNVKPTYKTEYVRTSNDYDHSGDNFMQLCEKLYGSKLVKTTENITDDFGRPATEWTYLGKSIKSADAPSKVYTADVKSEDMYKDLGLNKAETVENVYVDGAIAPDFEIAKKSDETIGNNGAVVEVYMDEDKTVDTIVVVNEYLVQATEDYDAEDEEVAVEGEVNVTLKAEDFNIADVKDEDYLVVTLANGEVKSVVAAEMVKDVKVTEIAKDYFVAGGTKYNYSENVVAADFDLKDSVNLVLDTHGYVLKAEEVTEAEAKLDDYLFVTKTATNGFDLIAKVVLMDGSKKTVTVADKEAAEDGKLAAESFYTFSVNKDGEYVLKNIKTEQMVGTAIESGVKPVEGVNVAATNSTVFIADGKVYTGLKNAPEVKGEDVKVFVLTDKDGYMLVAYTEEAGKDAATKAEDYVYIVSDDVRTVVDEKDDDEVYYIYTAIKDGKKVELKATEDNKTIGMYKIESYEDGKAVLENVIAADVKDELDYFETATVKHHGGVVTVAGESYILTEKADLYIIDVEDESVKTVSASGLNNLDEVYTAYVMLDDDDMNGLILVH